MSQRKFEALDLLVFTVIAALFEGLCTYLFSKGTSTYFLSLSCILGMIAIFRWNWPGLFVAPLAGLVGILVRLCFLGGASLDIWLRYTVGYCGLAVCLLFFLKGNKKAMEGCYPWMVIYALAGYVAVAAVRALTSLGTQSFTSSFWLYIAFDLLNWAVGIVLILLATHQDGMVVDMKSYLLRQAEEKKRLSDAAKAKAKNPKINYEELADSGEINEAALLEGGTLSDEDLMALEKSRREIEGRKNVFDLENEAKSHSSNKGEKNE